jgi:processive 1,2-diacylglycerol beta-glucosyltransferase
VVTDFSLHNRWLLTDSDRYYVATVDLMREMIDRGVPSGKILVSGIPVREHFYESRNIRNNQADKRTILVITGLYGITSDLRKLTASLLAIPDVRIDIVCGENDKLKQELERSFVHEPRLNLFGYVEALHERMRRAACVITKAGGITLSEAIQIGTPILIFKPFPGQEKENARYLESKGAAFVAANVKELAAQARKLLLSVDNRRRMIKLYEKLASGRAAESIVQDVLGTSLGRRMRSKGTLFERIGV